MPQARPTQPMQPGRDQPGLSGLNRPAVTDRRAPPSARPDFGRPDFGNANNRPGAGNRPGGNINIDNSTNINVVGNNRPGYNNRYPVYRPPGGGYYRPPNGGYYGPPRPPYGGWHGGYYPPRRYYYNDGPSVGDVLFGVAVTTSLLALLSAATRPPPPQIIVVQGAPPPPPLPLEPYRPPANISGAPATINVDINSMSADARPTASTCLTEAARQIGATGGSEISIDSIVEVEKGNGGYRFRLTLLGVYPDETRAIPMYCRATPDKIIELTFG